MKVGSLVKHKSFAILGIGIVTEARSVHCKVLWSFNGASKEPTIETNAMMEIVSESR
jgi:hypothetical protein